MTEWRNFCNKCFKFQKGNTDLELIYYSCAHICCRNCVDKKTTNTCIICRVESKSKKLDDAFKEFKDPKFLYTQYKNSIRFQQIQENILFYYYYDILPAEKEQKERNIKEKEQKGNELTHENEVMEAKIEKLNHYIDFYEKHFKGELNEHERHLRPKTPTLDSESSGSDSVVESDSTEDTFSLLKEVR